MPRCVDIATAAAAVRSSSPAHALAARASHGWEIPVNESRPGCPNTARSQMSPARSRAGSVSSDLRVGTQSENMRQAAARGRAVGPRPGRVDVRGQVGASRAIQAALRAATGRSPTALAAVLAAVIAEGDPLRDLHPLFDLPDDPAGTSMAGVAAFPGAVAAVLVVRVGGGARSSRCRCLAGSTHGGPV